MTDHTTVHDFPAISDIPCRSCGVIGEPRVEHGTWGPHRRRLVCAACGTFLRWLPVTSPEQRQQHREEAIARWMASQPPTAKQVKFLKHIGHSGEAANRLEASQLIDQLKQRKAQA